MTNEKGAYFLDIVDMVENGVKQVSGAKSHRFFERLRPEIDGIFDNICELSEKTLNYNVDDTVLRLAVETGDKLNRVNAALQEWLKQEIA